MTKTAQFLMILHHLSNAPSRCLSEVKLKKLLGDPPKSTWHRMINELIVGLGEVPALLMKTEDHAGQTFYCVNHRGWQAFMDAHEEGRFLLECYRQVGYLLDSDFTNMVFDLPDLDKKQINRIERKFLHLVKVKAQQSHSSKKTLNAIIETLIGEKQLEITYDGGLRIVRPLTLCQHRDELYLMCYRMKQDSSWEKRTYKLTRITATRVLDRKFPYPSKSEWDPLKEYELSSGIVLGPVKRVQIRVYGNSRKIVAEKDFFSAQLINRDKDSETYLCTYTNPHEFLGQIFVYAQDIEILDDVPLQEMFNAKAQAALSRNRPSKKAI
jgi:predicted DNA-binding transcriptional regulator YafY